MATAATRKKYEAEFTTKFQKWVKRVNLGTFVFEAKHTRGANTFDCSELKEHQYQSLLAATSAKLPFVYKIPDDGRAYKPFDGFSVSEVPAYVVICYPKSFVMIPVRSWPTDSTIKSLSFEQAKLLATTIIPLTDL